MNRQHKYCPECKRHKKKILFTDGKAIKSTHIGTLDFIGGEIMTVHEGGRGKLIDCRKCSVCGYSETK